MRKINPPLTDTQIRTAKAPCKLHDGNSGLWIEVSSAGKAWRTKATLAGSTRQITLGHYPEMKLADARAARLDVRRKVSAGLHPVVAPPRVERSTGTVEAKARTWHAYEAKHTWTATYAKQVLHRLERFAFPAIGALPVEQVTRGHVVDLLQASIEKAGVKQGSPGKQQADHVRKHLVALFDALAIKGDVPANPATGLAKVTAPGKRKHQPAVSTIEAAREVLAKVEASGTSIMVKLLHRFAALTGVRPTEARLTEWCEVKEGVWRIPAERMKGRRDRKEPHTVFLSDQALDVLAVAKLVGRGGRLVFTTDFRLREAPIGRCTINAIINRNVGKRVHVPHGWRAVMGTTLTALHHGDRDLIQTMLAHQIKSAVESPYDRTTLEHFEPRVRELGSEWARLLLEGAPSPWKLAGLADPRPAGNVVHLADRRAA